MTRQILLAAILCCISAAAGAQEALPDGASYPDPGCTKPQTDLVKPETANSAAVGNYNAKVRKFNRDAAVYSSCMHDYIDKANRDVQHIQDRARGEKQEATNRLAFFGRQLQFTQRFFSFEMRFALFEHGFFEFEERVAFFLQILFDAFQPTADLIVVGQD